MLKAKRLRLNASPRIISVPFCCMLTRVQQMKLLEIRIQALSVKPFSAPCYANVSVIGFDRAVAICIYLFLHKLI
jgi:hypothetical protein